MIKFAAHHAMQLLIRITHAVGGNRTHAAQLNQLNKTRDVTILKM